MMPRSLKNVVKCDEHFTGQSGYQENGQQMPTIHQLMPWWPMGESVSSLNRYCKYCYSTLHTENKQEHFEEIPMSLSVSNMSQVSTLLSDCLDHTLIGSEKSFM